MSNKKQEYDIIVIGGGPGGATAGCQLSKLGHKVLIIDKAKFPREKLCGGLTTHKTMLLNERVFGEKESSLKENGIINYITRNYEIRYKNRSVFKNKKDMLFYFVDRDVYDNYLFRKAEQAGANVIEGEKVVSCDLDTCEIITSTGSKLKGRYIIGADGVNSIVRKEFPIKQFNPDKWRRNLISTFEILVKREDLIEGDNGRDLSGSTIFLGLLTLGFAWMFPRQDRVAIGIGALYKRNRGNIRDVFNQFLKDHGVKNPEKFKLKTHNLPGGYCLRKPVYKNVMLVGDAGGFVDPLLGEGIFYSQRSGELASWAIHKNITEGRPLNKVYKKLLWKYIYPEFINEKIGRFLAFYFSEKLRHYPTKFTFSVMGGIMQETLHGTRTNRGFFKRKIHEKVTLNRISTFLTRPKNKNIPANMN